MFITPIRVCGMINSIKSNRATSPSALGTEMQEKHQDGEKSWFPHFPMCLCVRSFQHIRARVKQAMQRDECGDAVVQAVWLYFKRPVSAQKQFVLLQWWHWRLDWTWWSMFERFEMVNWPYLSPALQQPVFTPSSKNQFCQINMYHALLPSSLLLSICQPEVTDIVLFIVIGWISHTMVAVTSLAQRMDWKTKIVWRQSRNRKALIS